MSTWRVVISQLVLLLVESSQEVLGMSRHQVKLASLIIGGQMCEEFRIIAKEKRIRFRDVSCGVIVRTNTWQEVGYVYVREKQTILQSQREPLAERPTQWELISKSVTKAVQG